METPKCKSYYKFYSSHFNQALLENEYEKALESAVKGFLIAKDMDDHNFKNTFLGMIWHTVYEIIDRPLNGSAEETFQKQCSFCGRNVNEVKIVAGARGSICKFCVENIYNSLFG